MAWPALALAALLDPNGIPAPVLVSQAACTYITGRSATGTPADENQTRAALYNLARLGVVTIDPASMERTVRVHALVQAATRRYLSPKVLEQAGLPRRTRWSSRGRSVTLSRYSTRPCATARPGSANPPARCFGPPGCTRYCCGPARAWTVPGSPAPPSPTGKP